MLIPRIAACFSKDYAYLRHSIFRTHPLFSEQIRVLQGKACCFRNVVPIMKESVYNTFVNCDPQEQDLLRQLIRGDIAGYEDV